MKDRITHWLIMRSVTRNLALAVTEDELSRYRRRMLRNNGTVNA